MKDYIQEKCDILSCLWYAYVGIKGMVVLFYRDKRSSRVVRMV